MSFHAAATVAFAFVLLTASCGPQGGGGQRAPAAQAPAPFDLQAARAIIEQRNAQFTAAHVSGDVAAIDAMFTRDARSFPPGADAAVGPDALHTLTVEFLKHGVKAFTERTTTLYGTADLLIDEGEYSLTYGPENSVERGKYLNVWKQEDGEWKIHANIWNTSPSPAVTR